MKQNKLSRRQFLKAIGITSAGLALAACQRGESETEQTVPTSPDQQLPQDLSIPTDANATASMTWNSINQVATGKADEYSVTVVKDELVTMLDSLGGLKDILPLGAKVAMKVNLTGGVQAYSMGGLPAEETIATHPNVVRALGELLIDAGAGELNIVEAVYEWESYQFWGYEDIAKALNATLIDLNQPDPYKSFVEAPAAEGWEIYDKFRFNRILQECDTFISVSKMKCHIECGVTHTMKNLVGLVPYRYYTLNSGDGYRSGFHGTAAQIKERLPRVVIDLNLVRPIHLGVVDGIRTIEGGEGTWAKGVRQVMPGVLVAGKNPVATDAIATAIMGFDPTAEAPNSPFLRSVNHLNLANNLGIGTNRLNEIEVFGPRVEELVYPFEPAYN
jgi:uncharacterized protein (DUF362 family)